MTGLPSQLPTKPRLHGLDYLRGIAAFGIMAYHYSSWTFGEQPAGSFLGRVGIYGVAIFYILSGMALSYVYSSKLKLTKHFLWDFYRKRFFRIFPLLWLATLLSILLSKHIPNLLDLFLNLTGLFGLINWNTYFATGAWSIGNELAFYLAFPLLVYLFNKSKLNSLPLTGISFAIYTYFAFYILKPDSSLTSQWRNYTNPANQFFFFLAGALIAKFIKTSSMTIQRRALFLSLGLAAFIFLPINGNAIELVIGLNRLILTASCILICIAFFRGILSSTLLSKPILLLGQASYSLYLLHPIVYSVVRAAFSFLARKGLSVSNPLIIATSVVISLISSYYSYTYFEQYFIKISHRAKQTTLHYG